MPERLDDVVCRPMETERYTTEDWTMHTPDWGLFFDFHTMPANPDVGHEFDFDAMTDWFAEAGVDFIVFPARCNLGTAYYPTKLGVPHEAMERDLFGELAAACHAKNIAISAYINVGLSHEESYRHRDWTVLRADGHMYGEPFGHSFFRQMDHRALFVFYSGASLVASVDPPSAVSKKGVFFLKKLEEHITLENVDTSLIISDIPKNPLEGLSLTCQEVFLPLLMNPKNMDGLPEVVVREVLESFQRFISSVYMTVGQARGTTLLPLPPPSAYAQTPGEEPQPATTVVSVRDKDRIHALESSLVTWTRQIKVGFWAHIVTHPLTHPLTHLF